MATATAAKPSGAKTAQKENKTTIYLWEGKDKHGKNRKGEIACASQAIAKAQLRKQGVIVKSLKKKPKPLFSSRPKPIKPADIAIFTRQMATMMKAGVPLVQSFDIVQDGLENKSMQKLVGDIKNDVAAGNGFGNALTQHPKYFDDLFCNLVEAGEQSGALETMLDRVATYKEKTEALKAKIKKATTYPIAVVVVALIVTALLLIKVVPQFAETFSSFGSDLPAFTLFVVALSEFTQAYWLILLAGIVGGVFAVKTARQKSQAFSDAVDKLLLTAPIIGPIVKSSVVARFSRTLSTTFAAGVPLVDSLESVSGATGNIHYANAINDVKDEVTAGGSLAAAIKNADMFPSMLIQMVSIGEESGALDAMLEKVANHYEEEVDNAVDSLTSLLEPLIMSTLGVLVGGLMIAMYLPIFKMGSVV